MNNKNFNQQLKETISIENIVQIIFKDIYDECHSAKCCSKCSGKNIILIDEENFLFKCKDCNCSFSPRTNSLFQKIRFTNDKWYKMLTCMISDFTLEETVKCVQSNAETIQRKWKKIYESVDWSKYNVSIREKPTKNIYANFEVILS